jgi:hypothetical protein
MPKCRDCKKPIEWEYDEEDERWIPSDPDTHERHQCVAYEPPEREAPRCNFCNEEITLKKIAVAVTHGSNSDEEDSGEMRWVVYNADGNQRHNCNARKESWLAEQSQRTGRSEAVLCRNGCGTMIFWDYNRRSKINKKPLPFEQVSNAYHKCPKYNPGRK